MQREVWTATEHLRGVGLLELLISTTKDALANGVDANLKQVSLTTLVALPEKCHLVRHEDVMGFETATWMSPLWVVAKAGRSSQPWRTARDKDQEILKVVLRLADGMQTIIRAPAMGIARPRTRLRRS